MGYAPAVQLGDILAVDRVTTSLDGRDKEEVLRAMAGLFAKTERHLDEEAVFRVLSEREALASTGIGSGVAIPHGRIAGIDQMIAALGVHNAGVPFDAVDGKPAHIFVAVLAPDERPGDHLHALAQISRLLRSETTRQRLVDARDAESARALVAGA